MAVVFNKTMDRADLATPAGRRVAGELDELIRSIAAHELQISSWYGTFELSDDPLSFERLNRGYGYESLPGTADDRLFPWFLYWEIAWLVLNNSYEPGQCLLDLGGCSSLFSFYMASRGVHVLAVDLDQALVDNGNRVAAATGWPLRNQRMDIRELDLPERFDHIASVCVFEHLPVSGRIRTNRRIAGLLAPGGSFSLTFDYLNPSRRAAIDSPADVDSQFVAPSGLRARGNRRFADNGRRYLLHPAHHPAAAATDWRRRCVAEGHFDVAEAERVSDGNEYTFGALFLEKL